ncbi:hypothetical protein D3C78_1470430 [compost metagenome]
MPTCFSISAVYGDQIATASTLLATKEVTAPATSILTILTSLGFKPAFSRPRFKIISPDVPFGTPTVFPFRSFQSVIPDFLVASTISLKLKLIGIRIVPLPCAARKVAPGPIYAISRSPAAIAWNSGGPLKNLIGVTLTPASLKKPFSSPSTIGVAPFKSGM